MVFEFCPFCGSRLIKKEIGDEGEIPFCEACDRPHFPIFSTCVICLCVNEFEEAVLIKQDYTGDRHILIAGYMKPGESAEEAVVREIEEEVGLKAESIHYAFSKFYDKRDQLMLAYICRVKKAELKPSPNEVNEAGWYPVEEAAVLLSKGYMTGLLANKYIELKENGLL